jgi:hypothetical protein
MAGAAGSPARSAAIPWPAPRAIVLSRHNSLLSVLPIRPGPLVRSRIQLSRVLPPDRARIVRQCPGCGQCSAELSELASPGGVENGPDQDAEVAFVYAGDGLTEADGRRILRSPAELGGLPASRASMAASRSIAVVMALPCLARELVTGVRGLLVRSG